MPIPGLWLLFAREQFMIRILVLEGDECLWNIVCACLESEGYIMLEACNAYEGLTQEHARFIIALPPKETWSLRASD
jgi:hypothetical protein